MDSHMTDPHPQPNPNELLSITREELERCCSQMSAAGYKVSANYVEAMVLSRSRPHPAPAFPDSKGEALKKIREPTDQCKGCESGSCADVCMEWQERHDAAIRKAERERWGAAFDKWFKEHDCWKSEHGNYWTPVPFPAQDLMQLVESLRGSGTP